MRVLTLSLSAYFALGVVEDEGKKYTDVHSTRAEPGPTFYYY